jgi:hypothetical protein
MGVHWRLDVRSRVLALACGETAGESNRAEGRRFIVTIGGPPVGGASPPASSELAHGGDQLETAVAAGPGRRWPGLLVSAGAYLVLSVIIWWNVWSGHPTSTTTCGCGDSASFLWYLEWLAHALSHGLNPLYSTAMNYPAGVNLLTNTSELAIGVVLAPVTWVLGPVATLNVALTLAPALSALAMFVLLRRWVSWMPAAFIGGLLYGFSPFALIYLTDAHLMLGMAAVPPLIVACLDELLGHQRRPVATGLVLGLLVSLQFFIGSEALLMTVAAAIFGVGLIVLNLAVRDPALLRRRWRKAVGGLSAALATTVVLLAYPVWFALAGPAHLAGSIWPGGFFFGGGTTVLKTYLFPPGGNALYDTYLHSLGGYQGPLLSTQYFGLGLVVVVVGGIVIWWRDRRLWLFGGITMFSVALSAGVNHDFLLKFASSVPLVDDIVPDHLVFVTYLASAVLLGLIVDNCYRAVNRRRVVSPDRYIGEVVRDGRSRWPGWAAPVLALVVGGAALVPGAVYLAQTIPVTTQAVELPEWFQVVAPHLSDHQVVLVLPAFAEYDTAAAWQAVDGMHYTMVGEGPPAGLVERAGKERAGAAVIAAVSTSANGPRSPKLGDVEAVRMALDDWGVTTVVIPDQPGLPAYDQIPSVTYAAALITAATGELPIHQARAWVWTGVAQAVTRPPRATTSVAECVQGAAARGPLAVGHVTSCVLASSAARASD